MIEIPRYAFNPQGFFFEGSVPDFVAPAGNSFLFLPNFSYRVHHPRSLIMIRAFSRCTKLYALPAPYAPCAMRSLSVAHTHTDTDTQFAPIH